VSLPSGVYKEGDKGKEVKQIQEALDKLNFKLGKIDSHWGQHTTDAMRRVQSVYLPREVDGVYGSNSRTALLKQLKK
jgi:peptidoglycan hydrolase-like protein with peptidoglycan-binding domain